MGWMSRWWRQRDHYDWMVAYLTNNDLLATTRSMLAVLTPSMAAVPAILLATSDGPDDSIGVVLAWLATAVGVCSGLIWAFGTPNQLWSIVYWCGCTGSISMASLCQANPLVALMACTAFTTVGGYVAFFHVARSMLCHFVVTMTTTVVAAVRLALSGHAVLAAGSFWLILVVNLAVPLGIQIVVNTLGLDVVQSERDPLTGLLNRRSFADKVVALTASRRDDDVYLAVVVIDLDRFKILNDTLGHTVGDRALCAVATALRANTREGAVLGRTGGEEFVVADTINTSDPTGLGNRIREAIGAIPYPTTASVGTACAATRSLERTGAAMVEALITAADIAMYEAKRRGGNQTCHASDADVGPRDVSS